MSRLQLPSVFKHAETAFDLHAASTLDRIKFILNGQLWPASNFAQYRETGTTPGVVDTEFEIAHNLDRDPDLDIEFSYWLDQAGDIYKSTVSPWTRNSIFLKCTAASAEYTIIVR